MREEALDPSPSLFSVGRAGPCRLPLHRLVVFLFAVRIKLTVPAWLALLAAASLGVDLAMDRSASTDSGVDQRQRLCASTARFISNAGVGQWQRLLGRSHGGSTRWKAWGLQDQHVPLSHRLQQPSCRPDAPPQQHLASQANALLFFLRFLDKMRRCTLRYQILG